MQVRFLPIHLTLIGEFSPVGNRKREDMGMLEILQFIFSSFWIFCGTVILLGLVGEIIVGVFEAVFRNKK
jgi:hypothetical protein